MTSSRHHVRVNVRACRDSRYLFLLEDDFLLQHFDGVELVVRLVLGEQHLHEGLFVSGLFGKHGAAPPSSRSGHYIKNPSGKEHRMHPTQMRYLWKQMTL